ncbi:hypothetical protein FOZ62_015988, partial [Perkinsus olseni]
MTGLYSGGATFQDGITGRYSELSRDTQELYGEAYLKSVTDTLTEGLYGFLSNKDRSKVSEAMEHALLSPYPKYRYRVGLDCRTMYLLSFLPE